MQRVQKCRKLRDTVLIITNGKQTEKKYFDSITSQFDSMYSLKVEFKNNECDDLVNYASSLDKNLYNQIWCVFDIDETYTEGHLICAIKLAKDKDINIAYSNESFEVWLLYHLTNCVGTSLNRKQYIKEMNTILLKKGINKKYQKNDIELIKKEFIPHIPTAVENAKKCYQKLEAEHQKMYRGNTNYPIWNWKSSTTVYQLIESIKLTQK